MTDAVEMTQEEIKKPTPLVNYANAVHAHGLGSPEAERIKQQNIHDQTFARRVATFDLIKAAYDRKEIFADSAAEESDEK